MSNSGYYVYFWLIFTIVGVPLSIVALIYCFDLGENLSTFIVFAILCICIIITRVFIYKYVAIFDVDNDSIINEISEFN